MRIEYIESVADGICRQNVYWYWFNNFELKLDGFGVQERASKRHAWHTVDCWNRCGNKRDNTIDRPIVDSWIEIEVLKKTIDRIYFVNGE